MARCVLHEGRNVRLILILTLLTAAALAQAQTAFYVSPNGNDAWSGTLPSPNAGSTDGPFASLARAQSALRTAIAAAPAQPLTVTLRNGTYYLPLSPASPGTLTFTSADSGAANMPVTWQNFPGETPVVSGGIPAGSGWTNPSGNLWKLQLPANTQPFEYLFYNGQRRMRSRVAGSAGVGYYMKAGSCTSTATGLTVGQGLCNLGSFFRVAAEIAPTGPDAACPSVTNSAGTSSKCLDRFGYNPADPIAQWINLNPSGSQCGGGANAYPVGDIGLTLFDAWTVDVMRVSCVDTNRHIIYFTGAAKGNGADYQFFGPTLGHRYVVENTLDAFNAEQAAGQTGIWFLDHSSSPWTLNYAANPGENPNTDRVVIPQLAPASAIGGSLIAATGLSFVTFQGITFEMDDFIPPAAGFNNDENGESTLPAAIDCESCQHVTFDSVVVRHTSASGLQIASSSGNTGAPASNDAIQNSAFYDIGSSGLHIGHHPVASDSPTHVVQSLTVQNNIIQGYSRVFADGEGIAQGNGHDITYTHNDITDGYHAGISVCLLGCPSSGFTANGVNINSSYNHIWNVMQGITSDGGTLYYNIGGPTGSGTGNTILNNLVHDVTDSSIIDTNVKGSGYGGHGIYLDNQSAGVDVANNVVYRVADSTAFMTLGPSAGTSANTFHNNIFAFGRQSMFAQQSPWPQGCGTAPSPQVSIANNIFYFSADDTTGFYVTDGCADSCGTPYNQFQSFTGNLYWRTDGKFSSYGKAFHVLPAAPSGAAASSCSVPGNPAAAWSFLTFSQWQNGSPQVNGSPLQMNEDVGGTANVNPGFGGTGLPVDFQLVNSPVAGFSVAPTNDTILHAGRNNPVIFPPSVPATYPTFQYAQISQMINFGPLNNAPVSTAPFTISATTNSALVVSFTSTTPAVCTVSGTTVTLVATGTCSITASQAGNATYAAAASVVQSFTVLSGSSQTPQPTGGIANAASAGQAIASVVSPGSYVAIYGTALAGTGNPLATALPLPTTLNGTQATLCGVPMPLLYASPTQINALIPQSVGSGRTCPLVVIVGTVQSAPVQLTVTELQPGIYTLNESGSGPGIITNAITGQLISASNPARASDFLVIYCTGLGPLLGPAGQPPPSDGAMAPLSPIFHTTATVTATIGGVSAPVSFSGLTPTFAGLYQVNVKVPPGVTPGNSVPVVITATDSQTGATAKSNTVTTVVQ